MKIELMASERFQRDMAIGLARYYQDAISENIKIGLISRRKKISTGVNGGVKKSKV